MPSPAQPTPIFPPPAPWERLSVGQKLAAIFFAFFLVTAASLILVETLYSSVADASHLVNESGKLRYLSQRLAYYTAESALQKRPSDAIPALMQRFDSTLALVEQESSNLHPLLLRQSGELAAELGELRASWLTFRKTLDKSLSYSATILGTGDLPRLSRETDAILERADRVVSTLTEAAQRTHRQIDWLIASVLALNLAFLVTLVAYARWRIVTPLVTVTDMVRRFAAGDLGVRIKNHRHDEIGDLMRGFNQGAEQMENYIGEISRQAEILEATPDFIGTATPDGKALFLNRAARKLFGIGMQEDITGTDIAAHYPAWAYQLIQQTGIPTAILKGFWEGETALLSRDGKEIPVSQVILAHKTADGTVDRLSTIMRDIHERKEAQEKLRLWQRALESSVNAITITDVTQANFPYVYVNPAFERITGYSAEEALGKNGRFLQNQDTDQPELEHIRRAVKEQRDGKALLRNYRKDGSLFWNELYISPVRNDAGQVTHYIGIQNDVTERKQYEEQLAYQAAHDTLTQLPNRNLAQDRLDQGIIFAHRAKRQLALLFVDLDNFKVINDSLGHNVGDQLLKIVAQRLGDCIRSGDTVARMGGDDFAVILTDVSQEEDISHITHKILAAIAAPAIVESHHLTVTCSIGVSLYPRDGEDSFTLLKNADAAMYRAKEQGRNGVQYYTAEINSRIFQRLMLENSLRTALERNEFALHYQPQVSLLTGQITGMEVLLRWNHAEMGMISPVNFIPLAEDTGLIIPIGAWVLHTACKQTKAWHDAGLPRVSVAVNLSARQFRENIPQLVEKALAESGLPPQYLELEITESLAMQNAESTEITLGALRNMGVRLSIDDFGTGYSSLSYLKRFPINKLKLDQSFVRDIITDPDDAAISIAIIALAHGLKLGVIAEGVETESQLAFLHSHGCDAIQGYFFSRPIPSEEMEKLLHDGRRLALPLS